MRRTTVLTLACTILLAACGGSGDDDGNETKETPTPTATFAKVEGIPKVRADLVKPRMSEARVRELLGEPVLTQGPIANFPGGCIYYPMKGMPLADVWQYCLNERGVTLILTAFSQQQPKPPEGASPTRAALIARADSICQRDNARLAPTTEAVAIALQAFGGDPGNPAVREEVDTQIHRFVRIIEETQQQVGAFDAPEDERDTFDAYVAKLKEQADVLERARRAFKANDMDTYEELGKEFTQIGQDAKQDAKVYGFTQCSASTFQ
jgi:hypothetical protein